MSDRGPFPHPPARSERRVLLRGLAVALGVGALLAVAGAFGTNEAPLSWRLAYWLPVMLIGGSWGHLCGRVIERFIDMDTRPWLTVAALTAVITGPLSVVVWALTGLMFSPEGVAEPHDLPAMLAPVLAVTLAVSTLNVFLGRTPVQTHAAAPGAAPARFPDRLPPRLRGAAIRAVQSEDHYLRLHTDRGSDLILMRLSDALTELEGLEGAQTHRSWWVARDAVRGISRGDGRALLTLEGGLQVPVSRRYARALRAAGWY
ncbi:MAG TPA: LytTR family DNA-binding domain-containing protein [Brevundimonas sp.]|nr:LytTR family DNA-binding domain-containing protein [Brevundimonas sp.]